MTAAEVGDAYDARAEEYIELFGSVDQLAGLDRDTIRRWRAGVDGRIVDAGCGPGHWCDLLSRGGEGHVVGVDASARFIDAARHRFPLLDFRVGDLAALPLATGSVGGVLSWYSIIHTPPDDLPAILREFARVLTPGGSLLVGFFDGDAGARFEHAVTTAYYWTAAALGDLLSPLGFVVEQASTRQDPGVRRQGDLVARLSGAAGATA